MYNSPKIRSEQRKNGTKKPNNPYTKKRKLDQTDIKNTGDISASLYDLSDGGLRPNLKMTTEGPLPLLNFPNDIYDPHWGITLYMSSAIGGQYSLLTSRGQIRFNDVLGKGAYGTVYRGEIGNLQLALKRVSNNSDKWLVSDYAIREWFFNWKMQRSTYLLVDESYEKIIKEKLGAYFQDACIRNVSSGYGPLCLMPYLGEDYMTVFKTLKKEVEEENPDEEDEHREKKILLYILQRMIYAQQIMHESGVIHYDSKPPNFVAASSSEKHTWVGGVEEVNFHAIDFSLSVPTQDKPGLIIHPLYFRWEERSYLSRLVYNEKIERKSAFIDIYSLLKNTTLDHAFKESLRSWFSCLALTQIIEIADKNAYEAKYSTNNFWVCVVRVLTANDIFQVLEIERTKLDTPNQGDNDFLTILKAWFLTLVVKRLFGINLFMEAVDCSNLKDLVALRARSPDVFDGFSLEGFDYEQICRNITVKALPLCSFLVKQQRLLAPNVLSSSSSGKTDTNLVSKKDNQCNPALVF